MIASGPIMQICWVTEDIAATEKYFSANFGVKKWVRLDDIHFGPDACTYRDAPADFVIHVSLAYLGDMQLELIQPVGGESIYADYLTRSGAGMHHVCFLPDDFDAALVAATEAGIPIAQRGSMAGGAMEFAYVDGAEYGVPYVELARLGPQMTAFFDSIKQQSI